MPMPLFIGWGTFEYWGTMNCGNLHLGHQLATNTVPELGGPLTLVLS